MLKKRVLPVLMIMFMLPNVAFANKIQSSVVGTGIKALLDDLTAWLPIVAVGVGIVVITFCLIMRGAKDEMEKKKWTDRIGTTVWSTIGAVIGASILNLLLSYFGHSG